MKWIARVLVFTTALVFGTFAASLFWSSDSGLSNCTIKVTPAPITPVEPAPITPVAAVKTRLRAENLLGTWKATWGHDDGNSTILTDRVKGNAFYGTLRKEGAAIRFEGTFDPMTRTLYFEETKVLHLGDQMAEWSLGKNSGIMSEDGRIFVGVGHDEWGEYSWAASNY